MKLLFAVVLVAFALCWLSAHAARPPVDAQAAMVASVVKPTQLCPTAKTGDAAPACAGNSICAIPTKPTDQVRVNLPGNLQRWEPYATLTASSIVNDCHSNWTTLALLGITTFPGVPVPNPPVPPPIPPPAPPATSQAVTVQLVGGGPHDGRNLQCGPGAQLLPRDV